MVFTEDKKTKKFLLTKPTRTLSGVANIAVMWMNKKTCIGSCIYCPQGEYKDAKGTAENSLLEIDREVRQKWQVENISICHRTGKLKVGDINLVIAVASAHRQEGFAACQYAIDRFKQIMPTYKTETYQDGSTSAEG